MATEGLFFDVPPKYLNALERLAAGLEGPQALALFEQRQQQRQQQEALQRLGLGTPAAQASRLAQILRGQGGRQLGPREFGPPAPNISKQEQVAQLAELAALGTPGASAVLGSMLGGGDLPSDVQSFKFFEGLSPEQQEQFLRVKRSNQTLNLGGTQAVVSPSGQTILERMVTLRPEDRPFEAGQKSGAQEAARQQAQLSFITPKAEEQFRAERTTQEPVIRRALETRIAKTERLNNAIDKAIQNTNAFTAGFFGPAFSAVPGTPAADLQATIQTIQANIGFDELQAMRDASPTGGALGQISEREIAFLQSLIANLENSQSPEQLRENLEIIRRESKSSLKRVREAFREEFGNVPKKAPTEIEPGVEARDLTEEELLKIIEGE